MKLLTPLTLSIMDQDTDVHLRWNHHQTTLLSVFSSLLGNENLVDCTISAEGQCFKAHRVILSACSPYFELIFSEHCETHPIVILPDVKFQILKVLMEYMYSGEVKVPQNKLHTVLELAESLQIKGLSSISEIRNDLGHKRRNECSILCDKEGIKKHQHDLRYGSQVEQNDIFSLDTSEKESSEDIGSCLQGAQMSGKNSSNSVSPEKSIGEAAMFQDISGTDMFRCSSPAKTLNNSNTHVSGTLLNSVSNILDSSLLPECSKVYVGEQRMLSENVISAQFTSEELTTSAPLGVCGERPATDLLPQMKQEDPDEFKSIEEIILDDDTDESDNHHDCGSGGDNCNTVGGSTRVITAESCNIQGFSSLEQSMDTYFEGPESTLPKQYECNECGRSYQYNKSLRRHLKYECGKEQQFRCPQCLLRFHHKHHLRRHIVKAHTPY